MLLAGCADAAPATNATPSADLAARAVAEAKLMKPGRARDVTLREISRNLRHAERDHAIEAARAMSEDYELRSFGPGPDPLDRLLAEQVKQADAEDDKCGGFIKSLAASRPDQANEARVRECLHLDDPPGIVARPLPPFRVIMAAANALPPGRTKAGLLYMATWDAVPDRPAGGARDAVQQLRALLPDLDGELRREAESWLETTKVDLIEGRPDAAIARVRAAMRNASMEDSLGDSPADKVQGLIGDFLATKDVARAVAATDLLAPSADCVQVYGNLPAVFQWVLSSQANEAVVSAYLDRLQSTGTWARLCPNGMDQELVAEAWLSAGNEGKALQAATASGKPVVLAKIRVAVADRRLDAGDAAGAEAITTVIADDLPSLTSGSPIERSVAARLRVRLIYQFAQLGEVATAERLASGYPGPGWRGFAYSVIVATVNRARAIPNWGGPFLDLQEVAADL
ncbi:MAG: hypothetical protein WBK96_12330 [Candidatus Manganitrophaceae bacterium]